VATLNVLALLGSLRAKALSRAVLETALEVVPDGMALTPWPGIADLPFFNQDVEDAGDPASVTAYKAALNAADALLVVSPEYNSGTSAVLKNAIDWGSRGKTRFKGMPVALATSSPGPLGGVRCQLQLRQSFAGMGSLVMPAPDFLLGGAGGKVGPNLRISDEASRKFLAEHLARFGDFARRIRA
jgi:chromate reductase